jgi:hypothetical protein
VDYRYRQQRNWLGAGEFLGGWRCESSTDLGKGQPDGGEDTMHTNDIHSTMLHLMGLQHGRLTFIYGGRRGFCEPRPCGAPLQTPEFVE